MKTAGPFREPASSIADVAVAIIASRPAVPNEIQTAGVPLPIAAVRPSRKSSAERSRHSRQLAKLVRDGWDEWDAQKAIAAEEMRSAVVLDGENRNFVKTGPAQNAIKSKVKRLAPQGVERRNERKDSGVESTAPLVRPPTQHPQPLPTTKHQAGEHQAPNDKVKRHAVDDVRLVALHDALASLGHAVAVTVRLSRKIEAKARQIGDQGGDPLEWLQRRFERELKKLPGVVRGSVWFMGAESDGGESWHPHGELAVADLEYLPAIKEKLHKAAGEPENKRFRKRQIEFKPAWSAGWLGWYGGEINIPGARRAGVPGKLVVASGNVKAIATAATTARKKALREKAKAARKKRREVTNDLPKNIPATVTQTPLVETPIEIQKEAVNRIPESKSDDDTSIPAARSVRRLRGRLRTRRLRRHARLPRVRGPRQPRHRAWTVAQHLDRRHARPGPGDHAGRLRIRPGTGPPW